MVAAARRLAIAGTVLLATGNGAIASPACPPEELSAKLYPTLTGVPLNDLKGGKSGLATMLAERRSRMAACHGEPSCVVTAALWRPAERDLIAASLGSREGPRAPEAGDDSKGAEAVRELDGLNGVLLVYGASAAPRYPAIDGPDDPADSAARAAKNKNAFIMAWRCSARRVQPLDSSLELSAALLTVNDRTLAIAFDPLDTRFNSLALKRARLIDWSRYRYSAIVVPGVGPEDKTTRLSEAGRANVRMAADRYAQGLAPFIIVTGSAVHPRRTTYVEALEMRRALLDSYDLPANAIIVEPYARHTTTNLRNMTRRLIALGAPLDRDTLIVTNPAQSRYIEGAEFQKRNEVELGYQPGSVSARLSDTDLAFRPSRLSSRVDPADPLDP